MAQENDDRMRIDMYLYRVRIFKTRTLASDTISKSGARIERDGQTRRVDKPSTTVCIGDRLSFNRHTKIVTLDILELPDRRGPASEAEACYAIHET